MPLTVNTTIPVSGVTVYIYDNLDTADSSPAVITVGGSAAIAGFMQVIGTFGGASVALQGSNDGPNWVALNDTQGEAIAITAAGGAEFSASCVYLRPLASGGTGDDVDVLISFRG
jgi:hypothetical protein